MFESVAFIYNETDYYTVDYYSSALSDLYIVTIITVKLFVIFVPRVIDYRCLLPN